MSATELTTVLTATFGALGTLLFGFYKYAQAREIDFEKSRQLTAKAYEISVKHLSKSLDRVALASERAADEAKERNGHLAELQLEQSKLTKELTKSAVAEVISAIQIQNVREMNVEHAHVKEETVEHEQINSKE